MKKVVFTLGLCLVTIVSFGQKKAVTDALKLAKDSKPNFAEARALIKGALTNPETKDDPKTWFTAGQIESLQFDQENTKQMLQQQPDEAVMYNALLAVYPYFLEAYKLDNLPDAKGKVKPKYVKDIKSILRANLPYYINGGGYYFEQKDFRKALECFNQTVEVIDNPFMKDGATITPGDSTYLYANYYGAIAAAQLDDHELAVKAMTRASKTDFKQNDVYQYLSEEYSRVKDTLNWEKTLNEGLALFPNEEFFIFRLIGIYIDSDRNTKALEYIQAAIKNNPDNAQLFHVAGRIYELGLKDYDKAEENFKKSIQLNGENAETHFDLGRIYFNQGVLKMDEANEIADVKKYNEEKEKAKELYKKAMPYLETALKLDPDTPGLKVALRSIYYNLDMEDKFNEISALMNISN